MKTIKIGIIDDDSSKVTQIMTYLTYGVKGASKQKIDKYSDVNFDIVEMKPTPEMEDITDDIIKEKIDAALIDYNLKSYATISYTGVQLAKYIQEKFLGFPLFILTSYEDELYEQEIFDTYQIFDFERYLSEEKERIELNYKLIEQVAKYHKQIEQWKNDIKELLPQRGKNAEVDNRILELDDKLEKSINGHSAIPSQMKTSLKSDKIEELINKIDLLLKEE